MPGGVGSPRADKFDLKGLKRFIEKYNKELDLYVQVSFTN